MALYCWIYLQNSIVLFPNLNAASGSLYKAVSIGINDIPLTWATYLHVGKNRENIHTQKKKTFFK